MKHGLIGMAVCALAGPVLAGAAPALSQETLDDIAKHQQIAAAHSEAAKCLASGQSDAVCEGKLLAACKGIAFGRFCGMKH